MITYGKLTQEQINFIGKNYYKLAIYEIARILDLCPKRIQRCAQRLGITRTNISDKYDINKLLSKKVNRLTLLYETERINNKRCVAATCECNPEKIKIFNLISVINGITKSCGCLKKSKSFYYKKTINNSLIVPYKSFTQIINSAKRRNLEFTITIEYISNLFIKQNKKCKLSGLELSFLPKTASLDRIDSSKGYIEGNVQWIHKNINKMKMEFSQDYFIQTCKSITENHNNQPLFIPDSELTKSV